MSNRNDTATANAHEAARRAVNAVVWVMKPGPMADVAIRNMAPRNFARPLSCASAGGATSALEGPRARGCGPPAVGLERSSGVCDIGAPGDISRVGGGLSGAVVWPTRYGSL